MIVCRCFELIWFLFFGVGLYGLRLFFLGLADACGLVSFVRSLNVFLACLTRSYVEQF